MNKEKFEVLEDKEILEQEKEFVKKATFKTYGGFWRRLASSLIDWVPSYIAMFFAILATWINLYTGDLELMIGSIGFWDIPSVVMFAWIFAIIVTIANIAYNVYLYFKEGKTLGYKVLGMEIISSETGTLPTAGRLTGRWVVKSIITLFPYISTIGIFVTGAMIAWHSKKQGPHDMILKTLVVMKEESKRKWLVWVVNLLSFLLLIGISIFVAIFMAPYMYMMDGMYGEEMDFGDLNIDQQELIFQGDIINGSYDGMNIEQIVEEMEKGIE